MKKIVGDKKPISRLSVGKRRRQKLINLLSVGEVLSYSNLVSNFIPRRYYSKRETLFYEQL